MSAESHLVASRKYYATHKERHKKRVVSWLKRHPWFKHYNQCQSRCESMGAENRNYKYYRGKGIKLLMSPEDFKTLWFRDRAFDLNRPSIDRIDSNGHYEINNCRFIEISENVRKTSVIIPRKRYV